MFNIIKSHRAFTLVELLIVTAILAILGVSAVVGFGGLGEAMAVKQAGRGIEDVIARLESEILVEKFEKTTLYFQPHYLIAVSEPNGSEPILEWSLPGDQLCQSGGHHLMANEGGNLIIKNNRGELIHLQAMDQGASQCVDFDLSDDLEWEVQLKNNQTYSSVVRFVRFEPDPEKQGKITLNAPTIRLELEAPYASRTLYQNDQQMTEPVSVTIQSGEASEEVEIKP